MRDAFSGGDREVTGMRRARRAGVARRAAHDCFVVVVVSLEVIGAEPIGGDQSVGPRVPVRREADVRRMIEHGDSCDFAVGGAAVIVPCGDLSPQRQVVFRGCHRCLAVDADNDAIALRAVQTKLIVDADTHRAFFRVAELDRVRIRNQIDVENE